MENNRTDDIKKYERFVERALNESFGQKLEARKLREAAEKVAKVVEQSQPRLSARKEAVALRV